MLKQHRRLKQLISSLSLKEKSYFKRILKASTPHLNKTSKLTNLLEYIEEPGLSETTGNAQDRKMMELLEERILDSLLMDVNLDRKTNKTDPYSELLVLHKKFLKAKVLKQRQVVRRSLVLTTSCAKKAVELEDYGLALQCLRLKLSLTTMHANTESFNTLLKEIDYLEYCSRNKNMAIRLYRELKLKKHLKILENIDLFISESSKKLKNLEISTRSNAIKFVVLYFEKERFELHGDFREALLLTGELAQLARDYNYPGLDPSLHEIICERAKLQFELGQTRLAKYLLNEVLECLPMENDAYQDAAELLFLLDYLEGSPQASSTILKSFTSSKYFIDHLPVANKQRWIFFECCLLFRNKEYKKCQRKINQVFLEGKPINQLNLQLRLVKVLCLISREKLDLADKELDALRKFIVRNNLRDVMDHLELWSYFQLLWQLRYCGYNFRAFATRDIKPEQVLADRKESTENLPLIYCLLPFESWLSENLYNKEINDHRLKELANHRKQQVVRGEKMSRLYI